MFSCTDEDNWTFSSCNSTESTTTLSVTIKLSDNDTTNVYCISKCLCLVITSLTNRTVHNENTFIRIHSSLDLFHFIEQLSFLAMTTGCIDNDHLVVFLFEVLHTFLCDLHRISLRITTIEGHSHFRSVLFQLIESTCSESISADQCCSPSFSLPVISIFCTSGCFSCTLKTDEHNNILSASFGCEWFSFCFEHLCEFLHDSLLDDSS